MHEIVGALKWMKPKAMDPCAGLMTAMNWVQGPSLGTASWFQTRQQAGVMVALMLHICALSLDPIANNDERHALARSPAPVH